MAKKKKSKEIVTTARSVISVTNLSKVFNLYPQPSDRVREAISITKKVYHSEFRALDCINFQVKKGETIGIIGSNGAGKSTLLKIITGVLRPTAGEVMIDGRVSALLELGTGFNPEYTGIENIELNGRMMGFSNKEIEERKDNIIRFADIGEYINQPVKNYSSGMFARLAFAVAISSDPEILIVDEALSVGDIFFQNKCFQKFDELRKKGTSILFVSHDISTVRKMCSKVLWIEQGVQLMFDDSNIVCNAYFDSQIEKINSMDDKFNIIKKLMNKVDNKGETVEKYPTIEIAENSMLSDNVKIVSAYVKDRNGEYCKVLKTDEEYSIGVVANFQTDLESVIVGASVINGKGITMLASNTYAVTKTGFNVKAGDVVETEISFRVPKIRSGSYEISPAVAIGTQENHAILTWLHGVIGVDIENDGYEIAEVGMDCTVQIKVVN